MSKVKPCSVCDSEHADAINERIKAGEVYRLIAEDFPFSESALNTHGRECLNERRTVGGSHRRINEKRKSLDEIGRELEEFKRNG